MVKVVAMACLWRFTFDALAFISSETQLTPVIFTRPFSLAEGDFLVDFDNLAAITRNKGCYNHVTGNVIGVSQTFFRVFLFLPE
ncbi:MAG TPA: hypothetical protein VMW07_08990 [Gallionella sp.]|nr:hypothetical protein [Gallionella sp.]